MFSEGSSICSLSRRAKWAFTTRRVDQAQGHGLDRDVARAISGDLVLGRVEEVGAHRRLQLASGRYAELYEHDLIVAVCGDRYASDQFEGIAAIAPNGADLLAGGGVVGTMRERHQRMNRPTRIRPIGLVADASGVAVNVADFALPPAPDDARPLVIGIVGSAMNSGKTTAAASLVRGLVRAGRRVAAIKGTGTGAFGDVHAYADAGAAFVADFTDAGMVSTYRQPLARLEAALKLTLAHAADDGAEVAVLEIADGVFQAETAALLRSPRARRLFDGFVFAGGDPLAAAGGVSWLTKAGIPPVAVTGLLSRSSLAAAEAEAATGIPVLAREELLDPAGATALLARVRAGSAATWRAAA